MARYYSQFCELEDDTWEYVVFDRRLGVHIALCVRSDDAEKIVNALNATLPPPAIGVFG